MKKTILLPAIAFILLLLGCSKEINDVNYTETQNPGTTFETVIKKVDSFRSKMNSHLKSSEKTLIDSVVWNLEALITFDLGHPDSTSGDFKLITTEYTVEVDEDSMVTTADVQLVYNKLLDSIDYYLGLFTSDVRFVVFTDVRLIGIDGTTGFLSAKTGYGINTYHTYTPFEESDDWTLGRNTSFRSPSWQM